MTDLVTVGMPFFNNAQTILMAVRSVLAQSYENWRLVLLDDGSTDGSLDLVSQIADRRVTVLSDGSNRGLASRLNQLTELADSPVLARMDADDLMHPRRLELEVAALMGDARTDLVCSGAVSIDDLDRPTGYRESLSSPTAVDHFRRSPYIHPTVLGRTEWFRTHPYDPGYRRCQDQELWVRTLGERVVVTLDEPLLYLREAGTVPAAKYATSMAGTRRVLRAHGRRTLGGASAGRLLAATYLKQAAYAAAEMTHQTDRLVRSRSRHLSAREQQRHEEVIAGIRGTPMPGIDA